MELLVEDFKTKYFMLYLSNKVGFLGCFGGKHLDLNIKSCVQILWIIFSCCAFQYFLLRVKRITLVVRLIELEFMIHRFRITLSTTTNIVLPTIFRRPKSRAQAADCDEKNVSMKTSVYFNYLGRFIYELELLGSHAIMRSNCLNFVFGRHTKGSGKAFQPELSKPLVVQPAVYRKAFTQILQLTYQ